MFRCDICKCTFPKRSLLGYHVDAKHNSVIFNCASCGKRFSYKSSLVRHLKTNHSTQNVGEKAQQHVHNVPDVQENVQQKKLFECSMCPSTFTRKNVLTSHFNARHNNRMLECDLCDKYFTHKSSLIRHRRVSHLVREKMQLPVGGEVKESVNEVVQVPVRGEVVQVPVDEEGKVSANQVVQASVGEEVQVVVGEGPLHDQKMKKIFKCKVCGSTFSRKSVLLIHNNALHTDNMYQCDFCHRRFNYSYNLRKHMKDKHGHTIKKQNEGEKMTFETHKEFTMWKYEIENQTNSRFVRFYARCNKSCKVILYSCFRNGVYKFKGTGKRNPKRKGTNKIGNICKAKIIAKFYKEGKVVVEFQPKHQGHGEDIEHLFLRPKDKLIVAQKISLGMDYDSIRTQLHSMPQFQLLSRKDISNIRNQFKLSKCLQPNLKSKKKKTDESLERLRTEEQAIEKQAKDSDELSEIITDINEKFKCLPLKYAKMVHKMCKKIHSLYYSDEHRSQEPGEPVNESFTPHKTFQKIKNKKRKSIKEDHLYCKSFEESSFEYSYQPT